MIIYKTIRIFHRKNSSFLYISLYLCGQEILPLVFLYEGIIYLYNFIESSTSMALNIKKLLVSQPKPASEKSPYFDIAEKYGVEIDFRPFIKVEPLSSKEFRQQRISVLDHTAVIFTARTAIDHFFHLCEELRVAIPETMKYFCMTEAIAVYLQKYIVYRKRKIFMVRPVRQMIW